jgi:hypothetical protein
MQSDSVRRRNNGTRDDVVSVHKRTCYWFTNAVNVHWGSTNKSNNEATEVATRRQGIIRTPNHPTYRRLFVEVTQEQKSFQGLVLERVAIVAVI